MRLLLAALLLLLAVPASAQQGQGLSEAMVVSSCGGGALPSGAVNQLTMDPQGRLCQSGIGSNVCTQAAAYLARTVGGNEGGNAVNITALICGLVTDGVITGNLLGATGCGSHLDVLYVSAQQNAADALLNLCGTSYSASDHSGGSVTFTSYQGWSGFDGNNLFYMDTGFNASTATSPNYVQNSANYGFWSYTTVVEAAAQMGTSANATSGESNILNDYIGSLFYARVNNSSAGSVPSPGTKGLFVGDRSGSTTVSAYWNGVDQGDQASVSQAPSNASFVVGKAIGITGTAQIISEAHIGGSLGPTLNLALYNRLRTYMTAIGAP